MHIINLIIWMIVYQHWQILTSLTTQPQNDAIFCRDLKFPITSESRATKLSGGALWISLDKYIEGSVAKHEETFLLGIYSPASIIHNIKMDRRDTKYTAIINRTLVIKFKPEPNNKGIREWNSSSPQQSRHDLSSFSRRTNAFTVEKLKPIFSLTGEGCPTEVNISFIELKFCPHL